MSCSVSVVNDVRMMNAQMGAGGVFGQRHLDDNIFEIFSVFLYHLSIHLCMV